jgi:hypothetical protein
MRLKACVIGVRLDCLKSSDELGTFFPADTTAEIGTRQQHLLRREM